MDTIGYLAFGLCTSLDTLIMLSETAPVISSNTFQAVHTNDPIFVPCGASDAYNEAAYWNVFYIGQEGIDDVAGNPVKVYSSRGQIVVEGAEGNTVTLYDAVGRQLAVRRDEYEEVRFDVQASGAYFIRVGNQPAKRIVAIR